MKEDRGQMMEFGSWNAEVGKKELRTDCGIRNSEVGMRKVEG
jgi:hypothetical protein